MAAVVLAQSGEVWAQGRNALLHEVIVHIPVGTVVDSVHKTWLWSGVELVGEGFADLMCEEERQGGGVGQ